MNKLLPCPFCGSSHVRAEISGSGCYVKCDDCDAYGSQTLDDSEQSMCDAIASWNAVGEKLAKAQRKPLTDEEIGQTWSVADGEHNASGAVKRRITRSIEAAHGIKEPKP